MVRGSSNKGVRSGNRAQTSAKFFLTAVLIMMVMALLMPARAQGLSSPSAGCDAVNAGAFNFNPQQTTIDDQTFSDSFSDTFAVNEMLSFTYEGVADTVISDDTAPSVIVNQSGFTEDPVSVGYTIPADGQRMFSFTITKNIDFPDGNVSASCTSAPQGRVTIIKNTLGGDGSFDFTGDLGAFSLTTSGGTASQVFDAVTPGSFTVTEAMNNDFELTSVVCTGDQDSTGDAASRSAILNIEDGDDVTCTFINEQVTGSIQIIKQTDTDGTFRFQGDLGVFALTTSGGSAMRSFDDLTADTYVVREDDLGGFALDDLTCTGDLDGGNVVDLANRQVSIDLDAGETVACTFSNSQILGDITIIKSTIGGEGQFDFSGDLGDFSIRTRSASGSVGFSDLQPGSFVVAEALNPDFDLVSISCSGDLDNGSVTDLTARQITIDLDPGESIACTFTNQDNFDEDQFRDDTTDAIKGFSYRRARSMLSAEPDRASFTRRNPEVLWGDDQKAASREPVRYALNVTQGRTDASFAASTERYDIGDSVGKLGLWIEGQYVKADDEGGNFDIDNEFGIFYLGADVQATENLVLGALVSYDWTEEHTDFFGSAGSSPLSQEVEGTGWMAGPYLSARLSKNLFFNARMAVGKSDNELTLDSRVEDDEFETDRILARASLTGNRRYGNWRVTPTASVSYFDEDQDEYVSKTGVTIPAQNFSLGRAELEPEFAYRHETADGTVIEPQFSFAAVWDFETPDDLTLRGFNVPSDELRGRVEGGLQINWPSGNSMRFAASYDGIGANGFDAHSVQAWVDIPFGQQPRRTVSKAQPAPSAPLPEPAPLSYKDCFDGSRVLEDEPCPEPEVAPRSDEDLVFLVLFDHDKSALLPEEIAKIDRAIANSEGREIKVALLEGHTDRSGSLAYNEPLSLARAVVVRDALIARGIPASKITYRFFGERDPAVPTEDGVRLRANRRTEVVIQFQK